jgi:IS30 family transposase
LEPESLLQKPSYPSEHLYSLHNWDAPNQSSLGCYLPDTAQAESETRRKNAKQPFKNISESALELVKEGLKDYHSPEQIAGRLKKAGQESLSHETIYQMIYQNYP